MAATTKAPGVATVTLGHLLLLVVAASSATAGIGHLSAARDHPAHPHIAAFFIVLALAQLGWAGALHRRPEPRLLRAGLAGTGAVLVVWVLSRTAGLPFVPGADHVEAVAVKDATVAFLEVLVLAAGGLWFALDAETRDAAVLSGERVVGAVLAAALLLALPASLGGHGHGDDHGHHGNAHSDGDGHHVLGAQAHADGAHGHSSGELVDHSVEHVDAAHLASHAPGTAHGDHEAGSAGHEDGHDGADHADHADHGSGSPGTTGVAGGGAVRGAGEVASMRYGPFALPPVSSNDLRHQNALVSNSILSRLPPPCTDCFLTSFGFDLVYDDGRSANFDTGAMLHHHVMFNSAEDDPTCTRWTRPGVGSFGKRIFASGNERTSGVFPDGYGLYVGSGDWWSGIFEIMNLVDRPQTVWVKVAVTHLPGDAAVRPVEPVWLDVDNCEDSEFAVPKGRSTTTWDWTSNVTGRIVLAAGHVHDGGVSLGLANRTLGEHVCKSVAGYGNDPAYMGFIDRMTACSWDRVGRVRSGDVLRLSARYQMTEAADDVMGIMMVFVYETNDVNGGTPAPKSMTNPPDDGTGPPPTGHHH